MDLELRTVVITGANAGLGFETARDLLERGGYEVILACRSEERGRSAAKRLAQEVPACRDGRSRVSVEVLDLDRLASVEEFVRRWASSRPPGRQAIHALVLNAGILPLKSSPEVTADGFERCFGVNYLGHFLLAVSLVPFLLQAGPEPALVVVISSWTHERCTQLNFEDLQLRQPGAWSRQRAYTQSKLLGVLFAYEFQRRFGHLGLQACVLEPGNVASDILRDAHWFVRVVGTWILRVSGRSAREAARASGALVAQARRTELGGRHFSPGPAPDWLVATPSSRLSYDRDLAARAWAATERLLDLSRRCPDVMALQRPLPPDPALPDAIPPPPPVPIPFFRRSLLLFLLLPLTFFLVRGLWS
jgi:NAD(P)-dependent dehydrogenase (short-subunit alcohol dehydrogenase family)